MAKFFIFKSHCKESHLPRAEHRTEASEISYYAVNPGDPVEVASGREGQLHKGLPHVKLCKILKTEHFGTSEPVGEDQ